MSDLIDRQQAIDRSVSINLFGRDVKVVAVSELENLPSSQPEPSTKIQEILNYLDTILHPIVSPDNWNVYSELHDMVSKLPSAQPDAPDTNVDTISRQAAIDAINKYACNTQRIYEAIKTLPSAQQEIIRCKDCKHWDKTWTNDWAKDYHYCPMVDGVRKVDFYCADAERREE